MYVCVCALMIDAIQCDGLMNVMELVDLTDGQKFRSIELKRYFEFEWDELARATVLSSILFALLCFIHHLIHPKLWGYTRSTILSLALIILHMCTNIVCVCLCGRVFFALRLCHFAICFCFCFLLAVYLQPNTNQKLTCTWLDINWLCEDGGCGCGDCWLVGCVGGDGLNVEFCKIHIYATKKKNGKNVQTRQRTYKQSNEWMNENERTEMTYHRKKIQWQRVRVRVRKISKQNNILILMFHGKLYEMAIKRTIQKKKLMREKWQTLFPWMLYSTTYDPIMEIFDNFLLIKKSIYDHIFVQISLFLFFAVTFCIQFVSDLSLIESLRYNFSIYNYYFFLL